MSRKKVLKIGIPCILIIVIATILIKMFTLDISISLTKTYEVPNLPEISDLTSGDYRQMAVAVDGKIIQGTGAEPQPTASTAKMILGLAITEKKPFELGSKGEILTITPELYQNYLWYINNNGSSTIVATGEEISQYDALASVFLASSNNMADSLAIWAFGSLDEYKNYATEMLDRMGLKNTTIGTDASGYSETTTSTAEDLACIASKLLENPVLREIVRKKSHTVPVAGVLVNTNQNLGDTLNNGATVSGVKTGYIGSVSGYNLISSYEMDGHSVTLATLGASTRAASFAESKDKLLKLSAELTPTTIVSENETVGYYRTWWNGRHDIKSAETISVLAPERNSREAELLDENLKITVNGENYYAKTSHEDFAGSPTFVERFLHLFGWTSE